MPASTDRYVGKLAASEKCFYHDQHFSDRFLMALIELLLTGTLLQMKWKVAKYAFKTLLKVREETWNNSKFCFWTAFLFFSPENIFSSIKTGRLEWISQGVSICYDTPGLSYITPINLNGNHKAQSAHLDGNIPPTHQGSIALCATWLQCLLQRGSSCHDLVSLNYENGRTD